MDSVKISIVLKFLEQNIDDNIELIIKDLITPDFENTSYEFHKLLQETDGDYVSILNAVMVIISKDHFRSPLPLEAMSLGSFSHALLKKIKNDRLSLSEKNLGNLKPEHWLLAALFANVTEVKEINCSNCSLNTFNEDSFNSFCSFLTHIKAKTVLLCSNRLSTLSPQKFEQFLMACTKNNLKTINLSANNLCHLSEESLDILVKGLPQTHLKSINFSLNHLHQLPANKLKKLMVAIANSSINELSFVGNAIEKMHDDQWKIFIQEIGKSKIIKLKTALSSGNKLDVEKTNNLAQILASNLKRSFVASWGNGLQAMVLSNLAKNNQNSQSLIKDLQLEDSPSHSFAYLFSDMEQYQSIGLNPSAKKQ